MGPINHSFIHSLTRPPGSKEIKFFNVLSKEFFFSKRYLMYFQVEVVWSKANLGLTSDSFTNCFMTLS
jgi:hypothetical protein